MAISGEEFLKLTDKEIREMNDKFYTKKRLIDKLYSVEELPSGPLTSYIRARYGEVEKEKPVQVEPVPEGRILDL